MPREDVDKTLSEQRAVPLAFVSGELKGAQTGWTSLEEEAFAVVECMTRLHYLPLCSETFIFTDHRNILFLFYPAASSPTLPNHVTKVLRWN